MTNSNLYPIKIIIADKYPVFREGLQMLLKNKIKGGIEIVAEAGNGKDLVRLVDQYNPDIVITDVNLPSTCGIEATRNIVANHSNIGVIGLSSFEDYNLVYEMVHAGAKGYLAKNTQVDEIALAITAVTINQYYFCTSISDLLLNTISPLNNGKKNNSVPFSNNELEVIKLICRQLTTKEIADSLHFSIRNIEDYSKKIKEKTGAKNLVGIALFAVKNKIVQVSEMI